MKGKKKCFVHSRVWGKQFDSKFPLSQSRYEFNFQASGGESFFFLKPLEMTLMIFQQKSLLKISLHKREIFEGVRRSRSSWKAHT